MIALGIDVGGTKISYGLINTEGNFVNETQKIPTPSSAESIAEVLKNIIISYEKECSFVAIATAGTVNKENSKVIGSTANLPFGYKEINFQSLSNKKVFIENDANCAAYAEYKIGAAKGFDNSITLTLGTGVGGGIIVDGKLLKGKNGAAGEMHFALDRNMKRKCTCGTYDCFESYASGNGLRQTGVDITGQEDISTYKIIDGVKNNDPDCKMAHSIWQKDIALGILGLANIFDPDCVVLSGSMGEFVDCNYIENFVNEKLVTTPIKIFKAKMGNHSGMIGAALLGFDLIKL